MMTLGALRRLASVVATTLALAIATFTPVGASASTWQPPEFLGESGVVFAPDGDGVRDKVRRPFTVPEAGHVDIKAHLLRDGKSAFTMFTQSLGRLPAGRHVWTWDGKLPNGKVAPQGFYDIELVTASGTATTRVEIDLDFDSLVHLQDNFRMPASVYPRSVQVHDKIGLEVLSPDLKSGFLTIRRRHGEVVLRRRLSSPTERRLFSWDARDKHGRPLQPGRYVAIVSGVEWIGTVGQSEPFEIWVSADRLRWRTTTTEVVPEETQANACAFHNRYSCFESQTCGTVKDSSQFPGGLTYQSGVCERWPSDESAPRENSASSEHFLPIPDAIRGVAAIRVAFSGASTTAGESDPGTLWISGRHFTGTITSSSGARTPWVKHPYLEFGRATNHDDGVKELPRGAYWEFKTTDDNSFDVDRFTVRARYLVPKG